MIISYQRRVQESLQVPAWGTVRAKGQQITNGEGQISIFDPAIGLELGAVNYRSEP